MDTSGGDSGARCCEEDNEDTSTKEAYRGYELCNGEVAERDEFDVQAG